MTDTIVLTSTIGVAKVTQAKLLAEGFDKPLEKILEQVICGFGCFKAI